MNGRERLLTVLGGEIPDRVPVSFFVQQDFLSTLYPGREIDRVVDAVECAKHFGFDSIPRPNNLWEPYFFVKSYPNWDLDLKTYSENGMIYKVFSVRTPERTLRQVESGPYKELNSSAVHLQTIEFLIKDELDFEAFSKYVPSIDSDTVKGIGEYCAWANGIVGEYGIISPWGIASVFNFATKLRDMSKVMMDAYIDPDFYAAYMSKLTEIIIEQDREIALATKDMMGIQGNIANSGLTGKQYFDEYILPYEKKVVDAIRETGCHALYHNCGRAKVLQKSYIDLGISAWETVADEPIGDSELSDAKKNIGDRITLIGNLDQVNFIKVASVGQVQAKTEELVAAGKPGGRYIFSCADYLEIGTPFENVEAIIRTVKSAGAY